MVARGDLGMEISVEKVGQRMEWRVARKGPVQAKCTIVESSCATAFGHGDKPENGGLKGVSSCCSWWGGVLSISCQCLCLPFCTLAKA